MNHCKAVLVVTTLFLAVDAQATPPAAPRSTPAVGASKLRSSEENKVRLARAGCQAGDAGSCELLAEYYENGSGVPKDESRAAGLYRKGCNLRDSVSCYNLGVMYFEGRGVPRSNPRAKVLFEKVCATPDKVGLGCGKLAFMYLDGVGVSKDEPRRVSETSAICQPVRAPASGSGARSARSSRP